MIGFGTLIVAILSEKNEKK
ncbi:hypothetical protein M3602_09745 [Terribacillus saccharophilus]|nr:hypothetical protein [Terribacillus saccharophilus]